METRASHKNDCHDPAQKDKLVKQKDNLDDSARLAEAAAVIERIHAAEAGQRIFVILYHTYKFAITFTYQCL